LKKPIYIIRKNVKKVKDEEEEEKNREGGKMLFFSYVGNRIILVDTE